jgi:hypothetical protein
MASSILTQAFTIHISADDQPKKRSKSAERVALETGVGELKLNVADGEEDLKELEANQEGLESAFVPARV